MLAEKGVNPPSFKSLSERVMLIGGPDEGRGRGRCTSMSQNIIAPGL